MLVFCRRLQLLQWDPFRVFLTTTGSGAAHTGSDIRYPIIYQRPLHGFRNLINRSPIVFPSSHTNFPWKDFHGWCFCYEFFAL